MKPFSLKESLVHSYKTYFRLLWKTFFRSKGTHARLTPKRFAVMLGIFPVLFVVQTVHWVGFILDEIFFGGYREVEVREPLFIVGVPRSGTTYLHRVLARDADRFVVFTLWELLFAPSVAERKFWLGLTRLDGLVGAPFARLLRWVERGAFGSFDTVHRISLSDAEEDYFTLVPVFACFLLILPFPFFDELGHLAYFDDRATEREKERVMSFYKSCLQRHLYVWGTGRRLLSKNVAFAPMVESLKRVFPDCRIVGTVRNPLYAVPSHISSMTAGEEIFDNDPRGNAFRDELVALQRYSYTHIAQILPQWAEDRQTIVRMEDMKDRLYLVVESLYTRFGYKMSRDFKAYLKEEDRRQKSFVSGHKYDLKTYDLSEDVICHRFRDVFHRYGYDIPGAVVQEAGKSASI
jgi:hypothetical protein